MTDYLEDIFKYLNSIYPISQSNFNKLKNLATFKSYSPNIKLVDIGDIPQKVYLLGQGVLRSYVILDNGKELTKTLFTPIEFFAAFSALLDQKISNFVYETLTECHLYEIDYRGFQKLCQENVEVLRFYTKYLEYLFKVGEENHIEVVSMDAKQRYLRLRMQIPEIDNLIPQYQIASYLNITPVQLSRIRSKLY